MPSGQILATYHSFTMQNCRNHSTVRDGRRVTTLTSQYWIQYTTPTDLCTSIPSIHGNVQNTLQPAEERELEWVLNRIRQPSRRWRVHVFFAFMSGFISIRVSSLKKLNSRMESDGLFHRSDGCQSCRMSQTNEEMHNWHRVVYVCSHRD